MNERKKKMPEVIMYTDGSSLGFPGPSGWAVVLNTELHNGYGYSRCYTGEIAEAYGLQAELIAVTEGLKLLKGPSKVTVYTDSKYIVRMFQQGWIYGWRKRHWHTVAGKSVANRELIEKMYEAMEPHHVNILWVRGHSGDRFNRLADSLAGLASAKAAESVARINGSAPA